MNERQKLGIGLGVGAILIFVLSSFSKSVAKFVSNVYKGTPDTKRPSGITYAVFNNNPLNVKKSSIIYPGEITATGAIHRMFENWAYGTGAGMIHLWRYINGKVTGNVYPAGTKLNTIEKIIRTWAPVTDGNDTEGYIKYVVQKTGIARDEIIQFTQTDITPLVKVMAFREDNKGASYLSNDVLNAGWAIAKSYLNL